MTTAAPSDSEKYSASAVESATDFWSLNFHLDRSSVVPTDVTSHGDGSSAVASSPISIAVSIESSDIRRTLVIIQLEARMFLEVLHSVMKCRHIL